MEGIFWRDFEEWQRLCLEAGWVGEPEGIVSVRMGCFKLETCHQVLAGLACVSQWGTMTALWQLVGHFIRAFTYWTLHKLFAVTFCKNDPECPVSALLQSAEGEENILGTEDWYLEELLGFLIWSLKKKKKRDLFIFTLCVHECSPVLCMCTMFMPGAHGSLKRVMKPLELKLHLWVALWVVANLGQQTADALNCWAISSTLIA